MTDIQISLMVIGGVIVVVVIFYNKWQERRQGKFMQPLAPSSIQEAREAESSVRDKLEERAEPFFAAEKISQNRPAEKVAAKTLPVDEELDCLMPITLSAPVRAEKIFAPIQALRHVGNKPVHFIGQRQDGVWENITLGSVYIALIAAVQLANRKGGLNEIEYSEFLIRVSAIADQLEAELKVPDMAQMLQNAEALQEFIGEYGVQLSINIRSNGAPWALSTLLTVLVRQGFDKGLDGRLTMADGEGGSLFSLSLNAQPPEETTVSLTLLLDVPRVRPALNGFGAMVACAKSLKNRLDGMLVDDDGQLLNDAMLVAIAGQVKEFQLQMEDAGITPGSVRALRLFN